MTEKERRIVAYHEAGHAIMSHLTGDLLPVHKVTIVSRGSALGYTLNLPSEERYLHTTEEFEDLLKVYLAGRAAEQVVFGRITNGAANDLEKATELARAMVFDYGMSNATTSRTMRADNYALSEETKAVRDHEQARLTDEAFAEAIRLLQKHRASLDRIALALLDKETLDKDELAELLRWDRGRVPVLRDCRHGSNRRSGLRRASIARVEPRGIHHLGVAVADLDEAVATYERLLGAELEHRELVPDQGVEAASLRVGAGRVELLASLGEETPVGKFLAKRGPGMHHVAYEVEDVGEALGELSAQGAELIDEQPRQGMFGLEVAFVHPDSMHGVLAEIVSGG